MSSNVSRENRFDKTVTTVAILGAVISFVFTVGYLLDSKWTEKDIWVAIYLVSTFTLFYQNEKDKDSFKLARKPSWRE